MTQKFHSIIKKIAARLSGVKLVEHAILRKNKMNGGMLYDIKNAKNGTILNILDKFINNKVKYDNQYVEALTYTAHL